MTAAGVALAALFGTIAAYALVGRGAVNYDTLYGLVWGHDLFEGRAPDLRVPRAPTPKPIAILAGAILAPAEHATQVVVAHGALVALGLLAAAIYAATASVAGGAAGAIAAAVLLTREPVLSFGARAYLDIPYVALCLCAVTIALRAPAPPKRGLVPLAVAGLLRPEAWLLSAAYAAYWAATRRPSRSELVVASGLVCAAPAIWVLTDTVLSGDPLWSLTGTQAGAEALERPTGLVDAATLAPRRLGEIVREPVLLGAAGGVVVAWRSFGRQGRLLLGALAVATFSFAMLAAFGLPVLGRYLLLHSALIVVLAAVAVTHTARCARQRPWLAIFPVVVAGVAVALAPAQVQRLDRLRTFIGDQRQADEDLHAILSTTSLGDEHIVVAVPNHRLVPSLAASRDVPENAVRTRPELRAGDLYIQPATRRVGRLSLLDRRDLMTTDLRPPPRRPTLKRNGSWILLGPEVLATGAPREPGGRNDGPDYDGP